MVAHRAPRALLRRARAPSCRRLQLAGLSTAAPKSWVPRDSEKLEKAAVSALLHEYSVKQQRTAEKMVPWFLRQMPAAYFRLVGDDERLAHLQATAGLFDEATGGLVDEDLEFRIVSPTDAEGRRHITYARVRDRPGTLERQVGALLGSDGGALENVKVFTSDCGSLCLNVFTLADSARPTHHATEADAAAAAAPHVAFASDRDGGFWAEAAVLAHAARCSPHYLATTRPDRWSFHRELHASVAGTESVAAGSYAAAADDGEPDAAWIAVAAPNALPANFLHKLLRLLGGLDLAVKRCHVDVVADGENGECVLVRVLAAPGAAAAPTALDDAVAMVPRAKWLDDVALDLALDGREPLSAFALAKAEAVAALGSLAHRTLSREDSLAFSASAVRHILRGKSAGYDAIADDAATLLLARTAPALAAGAAAAVDVGDLADRVERLTNADGAARRVLETVATHARTCLGSNADRPGRYALALALDPREVAASAADAPTPFGVIFVHGRRFDGFHVRFRPIARGGARLVTPRSAEAFAHESSPA